MNCRRVSSLLSAYLDAELTGHEMLEIRAHLDACAACRGEHEALGETKRLLSSLALRTPRVEFETLLHDGAIRAADPLARWLPSWLIAPFGALAAALSSLPRPRTLVATGVFSLAGLMLATARLQGPVESPAQAAPTPDVFPTSRQQVLLWPGSPVPDRSPVLFGDNNASGPSGGGAMVATRPWNPWGSLNGDKALLTSFQTVDGASLP